MAVPKAPVHKYRHPTACKDKVWASRQVASMEPEAKAGAMQRRAHYKLRAGVLCAHRLHNTSALLRCSRISHWPSPSPLRRIVA